MRFFIDGEKTKPEDTRKLEEAMKPLADEIAQSALKKIEPVTRIISVLGFTFAAAFLWFRLLQGRFDDGTVWLLFRRVEAVPTVYILAGAMTAVALWHLFTTVRFFVKRKG